MVLLMYDVTNASCYWCIVTDLHAIDRIPHILILQILGARIDLVRKVTYQLTNLGMMDWEEESVSSVWVECG